MGAVLYALLMLAMPFMFGIVVGVELVKRRPKSTDELLGCFLRERMTAVYEKRQWIGVGQGIEVSNTTDIALADRKIQIIVREAA